MLYKFVYLLEHIRVLDYDEQGCPINERKRLGFFLKKKNAKNAIVSLKRLPGFSEYPDCFIIKRVKVKTQKIKFLDKKFMIYALHHEYYKEDEDCDIVTQCGFFGDHHIAESYAKKLKNKKQFRDYPENFYIVDWMIDSVSELWGDGFEES